MRALKTLILAALAALFLVPGPGDAEDMADGRLQIDYTSSGFESRFDVYEPNFVERGMLLFNLRVRNLTRQSRTIQYRLQWYDSDNIAIPGATAWQSLSLGPNEEGDVRGVSRSPRAVRVRLTFREI